jgi:RNA polymerase sigma factor (sigma-70 family)
MTTDWTDSFNLFLSWLNSDRDLAAREYEKLRQKLIIFFKNRGCALSEDLADETFNRVMRRLPAIIDTFEGKPAPYVYKTAQHVYLDFIKKVSEPIPEDLPDKLQWKKDDQEEIAYQCLERCLQELDPSHHQLIISYYSENKQAKIDRRKEMAGRLNIEPNALRIRLHRIRKVLSQCIDDCLQLDWAAGLTNQSNRKFSEMD